MIKIKKHWLGIMLYFLFRKTLKFKKKLKLFQPFCFSHRTVIWKFLSSKKKDCHPETNTIWPTERLLSRLPNKVNKDGRKKWKRWSRMFVEYLEHFGFILFQMPSNCPTKLTNGLYGHQTSEFEKMQTTFSRWQITVEWLKQIGPLYVLVAFSVKDWAYVMQKCDTALTLKFCLKL